MARFELTVLFFICFSAPAFVSAITLVEVANMLDEGVKIINDITQTVMIYGAQTIGQGNRLKQRLEEFSKRLRSEEVMKDEAEKIKCIKDARARV